MSRDKKRLHLISMRKKNANKIIQLLNYHKRSKTPDFEDENIENNEISK